jgi:hypothetical protein
VNRLLVWMEDWMWRAGGPLLAGLLRLKGYRAWRFDERGCPLALDAHEGECTFVPDEDGRGWVKCAPGCTAPRECA